MIPSPILRVLSTIQKHRVQHLLMGGQACIVYGAAEFSRDADIAVLAEPPNLDRLRGALAELGAVRIAVPPFDARHLERGHAVHFRCAAPDVEGMRIDVMSRMRGVDQFSLIWERRTTIEVADAHAPIALDVMSLPDLVLAKKTQRDKDWPMIRRLVEANYFEWRADPTPARTDFWFRELRSPELLAECVTTFPEAARKVSQNRWAVAASLNGDLARVEAALAAEQEHERALDREYWAPLRAELEEMRREERHNSRE